MVGGNPNFYSVQKGDQIVEYNLVARKDYGFLALEDLKSPGLIKIIVTDPVTNKTVTLKRVRIAHVKK